MEDATSLNTVRSGKRIGISRSSHQRCSVRQHVLQPQDCNFIKNRLWHRCFPVNFTKFLRTPFLQNTSGQLLLHFTRLMKVPFRTIFKNAIITFLLTNLLFKRIEIKFYFLELKRPLIKCVKLILNKKLFRCLTSTLLQEINESLYQQSRKCRDSKKQLHSCSGEIANKYKLKVTR